MDNDIKILKKIRRFSKNVAVVEYHIGENRVIMQVIENEIYAEVYRKLKNLTDLALKNSDRGNIIDFCIYYADEKWISFLCRFNNEKICLNYSIESNFFERNKIVMKEMNIRKKDIRRAIKRSGKKLTFYKYSVLMIADGVSLLFEDEEETLIKIRK